MRLVIQRVTQASVTVSGSVVGAINKGYLVLVGIGQNDTEAIVEKMADKMMRLRIFSDENDKINLSLQDVGGQLLLVSQFTLYADCRKGNRPSFIAAGAPKTAEMARIKWNGRSVFTSTMRNAAFFARFPTKKKSRIKAIGIIIGNSRNAARKTALLIPPVFRAML